MKPILSDKEIKDWAQKESQEHFKNYFKKGNGTEMTSEEKTGEILTNYLIEWSTYKYGLIKGAQAYRDNLIKTK